MCHALTFACMRSSVSACTPVKNNITTHASLFNFLIKNWSCKEKNKPKGEASKLLHTLYFFLLILFLFYGCTVLNIEVVITPDGHRKAEDCMAFIEVINNNH